MHSKPTPCLLVSYYFLFCIRVPNLTILCLVVVIIVNLITIRAIVFISKFPPIAVKSRLLNKFSVLVVNIRAEVISVVKVLSTPITDNNH